MFSVIFDMDGTLLDTQRICVPAWEYSGQQQGFCGVGELVYNLCGANEPTWTKYLLDNYPSIDEVKFKKDVREYIAENGTVKYMNGAYELLEFFKNHNIKMAIASGSSKETIMHHLSEVGATHYFSAFVGGKDVENGKPAPDVFLKAAELLNAKPEDCFVFEDSPQGITAGFKAGMKCIGVPDIAKFSDEIKQMEYAELKSIDEAIEIFTKLLD